MNRWGDRSRTMQTTSDKLRNSSPWEDFFNSTGGGKPIPEGFVARVFLSTSPVSFLRSYDFKGKHALDLGCGGGRHSIFLSELGFTTSACEVNEEIVQTLLGRLPNLHFFKSSSHQIDAPDQTYDCILGANSIYYLNEDGHSLEAALEEICRVTKIGGFVVASLVGEDHFCLAGSKREKDNTAKMVADPLRLRTESRIRPIWNDEEPRDILEIGGKFKLHKSAELRESCDGYVRHLHYFSLYRER